MNEFLRRMLLPLGYIPAGKDSMRRPPLTSSFEQVRLRLLAAEPKSGKNNAVIVAVTSRSTGDGVTTLATGLAQHLARAKNGKVLLIDADLGGRRVADMFGFDSANHLIHIDQLDLDILTLDGGPQEWFEYSPSWNATFDPLRSKYSAIVVDTGSLQTDIPYIWSRLADHTILVVDCRTTTHEMLERLRKDLKSSDLRLSGFILNKRRFPVPGFLYRLAQ